MKRKNGSFFFKRIVAYSKPKIHLSISFLTPWDTEINWFKTILRFSSNLKKVVERDLKKIDNDSIMWLFVQTDPMLNTLVPKTDQERISP